MNQHEEKIKDLRTLEAKRLNYLGLKGKFGAILKTMGQPIIKQTDGGGSITETFLDDYWNIEDETMPVGDTEEERQQPEGWEWGEIKEISFFNTQAEGWHFDGLPKGVHLEIWFKNNESELKVVYKGYVVYKEQAGNLQAFVPNQEWQTIVENLYKQAYELLKIHQQKNIENKSTNEKTAKKNWLQKMKRLWGA